LSNQEALTVGLVYGCIGTQGKGKFTTIQPFTIVADYNEKLVISELATTHDSMKFF
jgi:hypothetical protein